jgi:hypothetical protein
MWVILAGLETTVWLAPKNFVKDLEWNQRISNGWMRT